jgi:VanZ family protein
MGHLHYRVSVLLWAITVAGVVIGELLPGNSAIMQAVAATRINDKLLHFGSYCLLTLVPATTFRRNNAILCLIGLAVLGGVLELLQLLVPGRSCEIADEAANTAGLVAGAVLVYSWRLIARAVA